MIVIGMVLTDALTAARELAAGERRSLGSVISELARRRNVRLLTFDAGILALAGDRDVELLRAL
jgi:hypothetical protein